MSDTVDDVMNSVQESEPEDVVVGEDSDSDITSSSEEEAPVEEAPVEEAPVEEVPSEEASSEEAPVEEVPSEEAPVEEAKAPEPVSTQEVVQNVQEILSSTETNVSGNDLENRVKVLEERVENLVSVIRDSWICNPGCSMDKQLLYNKINELH